MTPRRALRPCAHAGCRELVREGRCDRHTRTKHRTDARGRGNFRERGYDSRWDKVRALKVQMNPVCERCERNGRTTAVEIVHHKIPLDQAPELLLDLDNLESVCRRCHAQLHAEERR